MYHHLRFAVLIVAVFVSVTAAHVYSHENRGQQVTDCTFVTPKTCCDRPCCKVECLCTPCRCSEHKDR